MWRRTLPWIMVTPGLVWTAIRLTGWDSWFPAIQLMAFTPYAVLGALVWVLAVALTKRWAATGVAALTCAALALFVAPRAFADGDAGANATGPTLRVATANLHGGHSDPEFILRLVRDEHIDLLAVQEMDQGWLDRADAAGLADLLPNRSVAPEHYANGSGLFSRFELRHQGGHRMPGGWFQQTFAELAVPGAVVVPVENVHPNAPSSLGVSDEWAGPLAGEPLATPGGPPRVLLGDFNATLDHGQIRRLLDSGYRDAASVTGDGLVPTWPYDGRLVPKMTIDHVLADARIGVVGVRVIGLPNTDHRMVLATLTLPAA